MTLSDMIRMIELLIFLLFFLLIVLSSEQVQKWHCFIWCMNMKWYYWLNSTCWCDRFFYKILWKCVQIWLSCKLDKSKNVMRISKKHVLTCNRWDCKKRSTMIKWKILLAKYLRRMSLFYCMTCRIWSHTWQSQKWSFDEMTHIIFERWFLIKTHIFLKSWMK